MKDTINRLAAQVVIIMLGIAYATYVYKTMMFLVSVSLHATDVLFGEHKKETEPEEDEDEDTDAE